MSLADQATFARIISQVGAAPWVPFDSTAAEQLAQIAVNVGFVATTGDFMPKIAAAPTATLLEFVIYAAGNIILAT
jgi:hypothetical protein